MTDNQKGALVLIPNQLGENPRSSFEDHPSLVTVFSTLDGVLAESSRGARAILKRLHRQLPIEVLEKNSSRPDKMIYDRIANGERWGFVSDAGWPAIADPGAELVFEARKRNLNIEICPGSSSLTLALALSGLPSQTFFFHGYLPIKVKDLEKSIRAISTMISVQAHLCIEAPYRNQRLLGNLVQFLPLNWWLSICSSLTLADELVITKRVDWWKKKANWPQLQNRPTVFVFSSRA